MMDKVSTRMARGWLTWLAALALLVPAAGRSQDIIINEILAGNNTTAPLVEFPEYFPDYVELYNNSSRDINLGLEGWSITDDVKVTNKYRFPIGLVFPADSYLLVFCDNESPTNFPGLDPYYNQHTGFNLDAKGGENIALFRAGGASFVTSNGFGIQIPGFSVGRFPGANAGTPFGLTYPTPCGGTVPCETNLPYTTFGSQFTLKINEWVNTNTFGADWLEVFNPDTNIVELGGLVFTDDQVGRVGFIRAVPDRSYIAGQSFVRLWCDGLASKDADHLDFSLSSCSDCSVPPPNGILDRVYLFARDRFTVIDNVIVGAQLFRRPGYSQGRIPDGETNLFIFSNPTPEESNVAPIPEINITEILTHTDPPLEDAVELQNVTGTNVNIGYWWLSNNKFIPKKYQIPANTIIPPGGFHVIYEKDFNNSNLLAQPFTFNSARGDECYLFKGDAAGNVLGFRKGITFGPALNGVSFGRYVTSDGNVEFVPMPDLSFGTSVRAGDDPGLLPFFRTGPGETNPYPRMGPIAINEIHYKPINTAVIPNGPLVLDDSLHEYVELRNTTSSNIALYYILRPGDDINFLTNGWKIEGVIEYDFDPSGFPFLSPNEYILLVNFDPATNAAFTAEWRGFFTPAVPNGVRLFGPYRGKLSNSGGSVELFRPDAPQRPPHPDAGLVPYALVERVQYADLPPWPTNAANGLKIDGGGASLQRSSSYEFGNDPTNWFGLLPTPGSYNSPSHIEILVQPRSAGLVNPGVHVDFTCLARGDGPVTYRWHHNGEFTGITTTTLSLPNIRALDIGSYFCVVSNVAGTVTSAVAVIDLNCPFVLDHNLAGFPIAGGSSNIVVTGTNGCDWSVINTSSWVTVTSGANYSGSATVTYTVEPNLLGQRSTYLTIAGLPYFIGQTPADLTRPTVTVTSPSAGVRVTNASVRVRGKASDNIRLGDVYGAVNIEVIGSGATMQVTASNVWNATVPLAPGTNWIRVHSQDFAGNYSITNTRAILYGVPTGLALAKTGSGSVAGATNGQRLDIGRNYGLIATPANGHVFSNWIETGGAVLGNATKLTINMQPGLAITANFVPNPFIPVAGTYNGLFQTNNVRHTNAGFFKLTTTASGTYTASIKLGGAVYPASGTFDLDGMATNTIIRTNKIKRTGLPPLTVIWNLGLNGEDAVNGTVNSAGWDEPVPLHGDRAVFNARTRPAPVTKYTVIIPPDPTTLNPSPQGFGYGTAMLSADGIVTFTGTLADGTKVSQSVSVAKTNVWGTSMWPFYVQLYANRGLLIGWVNTSPTDDLLGTMRWIRPAGATPKYYTNGFEGTVAFIGSIYRPPTTGNRVLELPTANVVLSLGNLAQPSSNLISISPNNVVSYAGPNTLTIKFTPAKGLFTGTFIKAGTTRRITFNGAVNQRYDYAQGFFLGTNETGSVTIDRPPAP